jgi:hypothetical protein
MTNETGASIIRHCLANLISATMGSLGSHPACKKWVSMNRFRPNPFFVLALAFQPGIAIAAGVSAFDPQTIDVADVIGCKIGADNYIGFVMTVTVDNEPGSYQARGWKKVDSHNSWMTQYHLPKPITVFGYATSDITFTSSAMLAVIALADPTSLAASQNVENIMHAAGRFMGEREISDTTEIDREAGFTIKQSTRLNISTVASHPGKTLIGCSYRRDLEPLAK